MRTARATADGVPRRDDAVPGGRAMLALLGLDVLMILLFAFVGRRTHDEGISAAGVLGTAWPFLAGMVTGWALARAWRRPARLSSGLVVWLTTVVLGMLLRGLVGDGTATAFVLVATATLGGLLLGWRALVAAAPWLRGRRPESQVLNR
jgi:peptidoglycan/LPS O-acetylase OafA/YrhL